MYSLRPPVTEHTVLSQVSQESIYAYYGFPPTSKNFSSPFRKDENPSCGFYWSGKYLRVNDLGSDQNDNVFGFVAKLFNIPYHSAIEKIAYDFGLSDKKVSTSTISIINGYSKFTKERSVISVEAKPYTVEEVRFWKQYGVSLATLKKYQVFSVSRFWVNDNLYKHSKSRFFCFAYKYNDGYKIYLPSKNGIEKSMFFNSSGALQGFDQLPDSGDVLVITKALKDVMVFREYGIPAVAPPAETNNISESTINGLKLRFKLIVSLYDFDHAGIVGANKLRKRFGIQPYFYTNGRFGTKDFKAKDTSDFRKLVGDEKFKLYMDTFKQSL
jgi:hypothetical protein